MTAPSAAACPPDSRPVATLTDRARHRWLVLVLLFAVLAVGRESRAAFDISMTVDGSTVVDVGQFRGITISYSWASLTENLPNAKIEVQLPSSLDTNSTSDVQLFGSAHTTSAVYDTATRKITFTFLNPLPAGSSGTVSFNTRFPTSAPDGTLANIVGTSSGTGQPNATDDVTLEANVPPPVTNILFNKWAYFNPMLGQDVIYSIDIQNQGTTDLLAHTVVDQLPAGTVFVSAENSGSYNAGTGQVTWNGSPIIAEGSRSYRVTVRYTSPAFSTGQSVMNTATLTGTDSLSAPVNKTANCTVSIVAANPASLFDKWDSNDPASLKGAFLYYFWVKNDGNVPLSNFTFTDDLPKEFIPARVYPGSDATGQFTSTINVWYKTTANSSWQLLPGSPFATAPQTDPYVDLSTIGLAPGEVVSSLRYEFGTLPVGYDGNWYPRVQGALGDPVTGLDRNGAAIPAPQTISNTYNVTYEHGGNTYTGSDTETTELLGPSPIPSFTIIDPDPESYIPLQEIEWTMRMENQWTASEALINPVYATLLPANLEFVPGSTAVVEGPFTIGQITTTVTDNYNGTGRQLVKFAFAGNHPIAWTTVGGINDDWAQYTDFRTKVKAGAAAGSFELEYHLIGSGNTVINPDSFQTDRTDTNDLDGDGNTSEKHGTSNGGDYTINTSTAIDSVLWVKGQLDAAFNRYPDAGFALPGGSVEYKLIVSNPGNIPLTGIRVMDILPHVGDVGVILHGQSRGSSFAPILTSTVSAPAGITVKYSAAANPVRTDLDATLTSPAGAVSGTFSTTAPSPLSNTKSLLFDFGALVLGPAESKEITWTMQVPAGVTIGQVAWNSFGHRSQSAASGTPLPPSEPIKVGTAVPISIGSFVWSDTDNDGIQDAGEPGISGATLQIFKSDGSPALDPLGNPVAAATTNGSGIYAFGALADGDYFVRITVPGGVVPSAVQTADPDNDSDTDSNIDTSRSPPAGSHESGIFTFAVNTEPTVEPGAGGTQDDVDDNNGNMTIDFGFGGCAKNALFVSNFFNGTIDAYDLSGNPLGVVIGNPGGGGYSGLGQYEVIEDAAGDFLFTGSTSSGVRKFDNPSGADLGWLIAPGSGGLNSATDADLGPDGHLYITSATSPGSIKRFNGTTGAFMDTFVSGFDPFQSTVWAGGNLYTLAADGHLYRTAYSAGAGTAVDLGNLGFTGRGAAVRGSKLYFNGYDGVVRSYDLGTGTLAVFASPPAGYSGVTTGLDFDTDGNLYVSSYGGHSALYDSFNRGYLLKAAPAGGTMTVLRQDPAATSAQPMPLSGSKDVVAVCWTPPAYDLSLITRLPSGQAASVLMGSTVNYEIVVKNQGQLGTGGFTVTARLPAGMSYVSASGTGFNCTESGGVVACVYTGVSQSFINNLAPGATATVTINGQLEAAPGSLKPYRLWAEISSDFGNDLDSTPDANTGSDNASGTGAAPNDLVVNHNDINHIGQTSDEDDNDYEDIDVFPPPLSVGNLVWNDTNNNGTKDVGELGLSGATVQLFNPGSDNAIGGSGGAADTQVGGNFVTITGSYVFTGLSAGKYFVKVTPPAGYITSGTPDTADNADDNDNNGSQPGGLGNPIFSPIIDLAVAAESTTDGDGDSNTNLTVDFGLWPGIAVGNQVWLDANDNGIKDAGETTGISGLLVELLNASTNAVITTTTTNGSGQYGFMVYRAGTYKVRVTPNAAYPIPSIVFVAADNAVDNDNNGDQPGIKGTPSTSGTITLTAMGEPGSAGTGNTENTIDFGFRPCPTIAVVSVPAPLEIAVMRRPYSAQINASGGMLPHTFTVIGGSLPPGLSLAAGGLISGIPTATGIYNATIQAADAKTCTGQMSIAIEVLPPLSLGNLVFLDANGNGHHDAGEGVNGVTVQLYTNTQAPGTDAPLAVVTTAGGGLYLFEGLLPGGYRIHIPAAMFATGAPLASTISIPEGLSGDDDAGEDGVNSLTPATSGISSGIISLQVGTAPTDLNGETGVNNTSDNDYDASINLTVDFGFANPLGVGNLVFLDANNNGKYNPGEGAAGVDVELFRAGDNPSQAAPLAVTQTEPDGHFLFDFLPAGNYFMRIPPSEFGSGGPLEGKVSVSGAGTSVADDQSDENGFDDPAPNLNGIRTADFNLANNSEPTDATGEDGYLAGEDVRDDNNYDLTIDFGFRLPNPNAVGVGNLVFHDANGNGFVDAGEGVDGVTVKLFAAGANPLTGNAIAATTTAGGGFYIFSDLEAGSYFVFIPPQAFAAGAPLHRMLSRPGQGGDFPFDDDQDENGDDPVDPAVSGVRSTDFDLAPNTEPDGGTGENGRQSYADDTDDDNTDLTIDFAFYRPVGVGNLVFIDLNRDGGFDAGEGIDGVDVELYRDTQSPGFEPPLAATTTAGGGFYLFDGLEPGSYLLHIPTGEFLAGGTLEAFSPLSGQGADDGTDDEIDENGSDPPLAWAEGVTSLIITLASGTEPTDATTELGQGKTSDNAAGDSDIDLTVDFGFFAGPPSSFSAWQASHPLGGLNGPADDPEGDGIVNLAEYAFGLVPDTGVMPWCPFEIVLNSQTSQIDAVVRQAEGLDDVVITLQGIAALSASPGGWFDITEIDPESASANGIVTLSYRHLEQLSAFAAGAGNVRLKIELDADHDSISEATTYSECWGWQRTTFGAYMQTFSRPYTKCAAFTGTVDAIAGSALTLATAAGTESIVAKMTGGQFYIEVLNGENEGHRFEVNEAASTATGIALDTASLLNTAAILPAATFPGDRVALRPHVTLAEMLPPAQFRATNSQGTADRVLYYTGTSFTSHWLFSNAGNPRWVTGAQLTNMNTRAMPPGEAVLVHPRTIPASIVSLGVVRACKFACPLKAGTNFIAGGWPMEQSPASRGMNVAAGFKGANSASSADRIQLWKGDLTPGLSGYESHYLLKSGAIERWVRVGDTTLTDEMHLPLFKPMQGAYVISVLGLPGYVMPRPWTP